jgi:hypothetical protein
LRAQRHRRSAPPDVNRRDLPALRSSAGRHGMSRLVMLPACSCRNRFRYWASPAGPNGLSSWRLAGRIAAGKCLLGRACRKTSPDYSAVNRRCTAGGADDSAADDRSLFGTLAHRRREPVSAACLQLCARWHGMEAREFLNRGEAGMTFPNLPVATLRVARITQRDKVLRDSGVTRNEGFAPGGRLVTAGDGNMVPADHMGHPRQAPQWSQD